MIRKSAVFLTVLLFLHTGTAFSEDVRVTSTFDKRSVQIDEEIRLTIKVSGAQGNIQAPRLPAMDSFDTFYTGRASHLTFINGQSSSTVEFTYLLVPKAAGKYTLDPIEVGVGDRTFRTEAITIEVLGSQGRLNRPLTPQLPAQTYSPPAQTAQPLQPASVPALPGGTQSPASVQPPVVQPAGQDDNIFIQAWVDKTSVYPNEQVLLTYSLYTRYDTRYEGFEEEPSVSGFWIEEFPMEKEIARETVHVNGKRYVKANIRKMALFPTAAAQYTIDPGKLRLSIRQQPQQTSVFDDFFDDSFFSSGGFFARRENRIITPPKIYINVNPLPEAGKPASFQGSVGNYQLTANIEKRNVKQNEPVTMTLVVEGQGNIETLNKPALPELPQFKIYEADTSTQLFKTGDVIGGRKTFEIVFIPKAAGNLSIPALEFSFFNPQAARYVTLSTPVFPLTVEPSTQEVQMPSALSQQNLFKKEVELEGKDIRFIWERLPDPGATRIFATAFWVIAAADILLLLLCLTGLARLRTEKIYSRNTALRRRKTAKPRAQARIRKLHALARSNKDKSFIVFYEEIDKTLTQYLADKFDLSAFGGTRREIEEELTSVLGNEDALHKEILEVYHICDESRFGGAAEDAKHKEYALGILNRAINKMEKVCK